jgi:formylglycine-generating enzyme required for sulfatase activity
MIGLVSKALSIGVMLLALAGPVALAAITIDTVHVGDAGNADDPRTPGSSEYGAVSYEYEIGKYKVTAGQYTAFLNAVARQDQFGLYNPDMANIEYGSGIFRTGGGTVGFPYLYIVDSAFENRPVNYVSWGDAARFANWLHNGQPNTGAQTLATTENGAYFINGATSDSALLAINRESDWKWAITSDDEWYKAAYYDPTLNGGSGGYFDYPTGSDAAPGRSTTDVSGNNANYGRCIGCPGLYPIDPPYYTTEGGEFQNSASPYGTFDQAGNVFEWNELVGGGTHRSRRGGAFNASPTDQMFSGTIGFALPTWESLDQGFRVTAVPTFAADFDEDFDVDADDLAQWEGDFGGPGSDADADGDSDGRDVLVWLKQFGSGAQPLAASQSVPEPSSVSLALVALLALLRGKQRG